jgi:hypothetical protein
MNQGLVNSYYQIKPYIPRSLQILIRSRVTLLKRWVYRNTWPIDREAARTPEAWSGWPEDRRFALVLTHDADTVTGQDKCGELAEIEKSLGFRSSFNFVITNKVSHERRNRLEADGFEVGIHGLWHDRSLYKSRETFDYQAGIINAYLKKWGSVGFRSPSMHHNLEWLHGLDIAYDASTFDTDPFEPQPDGMRTIFPFWVPENHSDNDKGYVELPYTLPQDFTLFVLFKEKSIDIWKSKLDWIFEHGGMALLNTHPDYMDFTNKANNCSSYAVDYYIEFLEYVKTRYGNCCWHVLPRDLARFWIERFHEERRKQQ